MIVTVVTTQLSIPSGGPAGGQTFEKFDKQVLRAFDYSIDIDKSDASVFMSIPERFWSSFQKAPRWMHTV